MSKLHTDQELRSSFSGVEQVVSDSLRFKRKLAIGGDAYKSIRLAKTVQQLWDVGGVAATGGGFAASTTVATTFFTTAGFFGIGATAVTPVGWIIAAAVGSGSVYYGVTRLFHKFGQDRVEAIPKFINTPIDLLGASLMDLLGALAFKVAAIDGNVPQSRPRNKSQRMPAFRPSARADNIQSIMQMHIDLAQYLKRILVRMPFPSHPFFLL